ncbi:MAG: hypothetical protein QM809_17605 [Gordonia sp. (in: high G+C Gram-positive bacteria)]|uniref:hypothetical protein n=1 Tax=Gordonia sp. (in: high G+C Gram-positive bacteria) TaxID=84139 RepID=UPI0039E28D52
MKAVEINAGAWYLRALRADDRISDVPALTDLGVPDPAAYVVAADAEDSLGDGGDAVSRCVWAVCIPTTGELIALIGVSGSASSSVLRGRSRAGHRAALADAEGPVRRFAEQALGLIPGELIDEFP